MAKFQLFKGLPDYDWRTIAAEVLNDGKFSGRGDDRSSTTLKSGDITLKITGSGLDVARHSIANGTITSLTLKIDGVKIAVLNKFDGTLTGDQFQEILDAGPYDQWNIGRATGVEPLKIIGSDWEEWISGTAGNDTINGGQDRDYVFGEAGDDIIYADDTSRYWGDYIQPGLGNNVIIATRVENPDGYVDGHDLTFTDLTIDVSVDLGAGLATGEGMHTTFSHFHWAIGGGGDDTLVGGGTESDVEGFSGMVGDDVINGKGGYDEVQYSEETDSGSVDKEGAWVVGTQGVVVNLAKHKATDSYGDHDTLKGIEGVRGTRFADRISGDSNANQLEGNEARDTLSGGRGRDTLIGGDGKDKLTGGDGKDFFVFDADLGSNNVDTITDFKPGTDRIQLSADVFSMDFGRLANDEFQSAQGHEAANSGVRIMYDKSDGTLWYDEDGSDEDHGAVKFAVVNGIPALSAGDIEIV